MITPSVFACTFSFQHPVKSGFDLHTLLRLLRVAPWRADLQVDIVTASNERVQVPPGFLSAALRHCQRTATYPCFAAVGGT
jgi:hypothetical protein